MKHAVAFKIHLLTFSMTASLLLSSGVYAGACASGGGGAFKIPTTPEEIVKKIKDVNPQAVVVTSQPPITPTATATPVQAPPVIAKVVWVKGTVKVMGPDKKIRTVGVDSPISQNEVIITDANSQAQVVFSDRTIMTFREKSMLYINKYEYNPEAKEGSSGKFMMNLIEGGFRTVTGAIAKTNSADYKVDTEVALMGVRGTDYSAVFHNCQTLMKRHSGTPVLSNAQGTIVLTGSNPYASVPAFDKPPVKLTQEPAVFKVPLKIVPATFVMPPSAKNSLQQGLSKQLDLFKNDSGSGGGGGGACAPIPGQFKIRFN